MDPLRTAHLNAETPRQIHDRLRFYRGHNAKFLEYFPDGTSRELDSSDPLNLSLLATTPFPGIQLSQVQQMMNTLRYFLFDLQNSLRELVPHLRAGPDLVEPAYTYVRYALPPALRTQLAQTPLEDEIQLQQNFVASQNGYYLDAVINRGILNFRREVRNIEMQERLQGPTVTHHQHHPVRSSRQKSRRRLHWSMTA
ncbi:hypothetical protein MVEN_01111800 [Mycena venus]|uniref:Uncharacterized protein n=1 Tax=Mycena venus TaxID=2733690 RepID=A0A8H6Y891_9AGAR|nr:hypothetical protein MVEN_01111800 [Mycena venus]